MTVTHKIKQRREELRYSRPQLAEEVGVGWETIKAYETKGAIPSLPVALKLAKVLELSMEELFTLEEIEQMEKPETDNDIA